MNIRTCIKFPLFLLIFFSSLCAETKIIPYDPIKDTTNILNEPENQPIIAKQTTFLDFLFVLLKTLMIIALFIAVFYGVILLFRRLTEQRFSNRTQGEDIKILERATLSTKSAIYLLEVKNKYFLIGESHAGLSELGSFYNE